MIKIKRTYNVRLFPTAQEKGQFQQLSLVRNMLWNELVDIEQCAFDNHSFISEFDLNNRLPELKQRFPHFKTLNSKACQRIAKEVYSSYRSFFALVKKDKTAKPPKKVDDVNEFHTVVFNQSGWKFVNEDTLRLNGINVKYKGKPDINFMSLTAKEVKLKQRKGKWLLDICVETELPEPERITCENKVLAIDLGLKNLVHGVDNLGNVVVLKNKARRINRYFGKNISSIKTKMSTKVKHSHRWEYLNSVRKRLCSRRNAQIKDTLHIQSKTLADMNYKTIVVGDLSVKQLMSTTGTNKRKKGIRKSFHESAIERFVKMLTYKCLARHNEVITLSERWTTQTNSLTGKLFKKNVELGDRVVWLNEAICIDRDLNAAMNIMRRYEQYHIALVTTPLDVFSVTTKYNVANLQTKNGNPSL